MESVLEIDASRIAVCFFTENSDLRGSNACADVFYFHRWRFSRSVKIKNTRGEQSAKRANDACFKQIAGCGDSSEVDSNSALTKITKNTKTIKGA